MEKAEKKQAEPTADCSLHTPDIFNCSAKLDCISTLLKGSADDVGELVLDTAAREGLSCILDEIADKLRDKLLR